MKHTMTFNLPEEADELKLAQKGFDVFFMVQELDKWLRNLQEYDNKDTIPIDEVRAIIREELKEIGIDDLYGFVR